MHEHVLTSQSQPFRDALTGQWKESTDREIDLQEWDRGTVVRMLEFLYGGSYKFPDLAPISPLTSGKFVDPPFYLNEGSYDVHTVPAGSVESPVDAYAEVLLAHAKVYHLAHYKAITTLQAMALGHVDRTLNKIDPVNSHVASVPFVDFIRYVYANTDHLDHHEEPLRSLVSNFVARNFQVLRSSTEISQLLSEGGDIVMDVMVAISSGLSLAQPSAVSVARRPPRYLQKLEVSC